MLRLRRRSVRDLQCGCGRLHGAQFTCDAVANHDPTGTGTLRAGAKRALDLRWHVVRRAIVAQVGTHDILALSPESQHNVQYATNADRLRTAQGWIDSTLRQAVIGNDEALGARMLEAYAAGVQRASQKLRRPLSVDQTRAALHAASVVVELEGVLEAVSQHTMRALARALVLRHTQHAAARAMALVVERTGVQRGHAVVDVEVVRAYNTGTLDALEAAGVQQVGLVPEWIRRPRVGDAAVTDAKRKKKSSRVKKKSKKQPGLELVNVLTAGDDDVCIVCEDIAEDGPYEIDEARDLIPAHPHCVLPGAVVQGDVIGALESRYSGPVVRVETASGKRVTVTTNHPVLTTQGWVAAHALREGMQLVSQRGDIEIAARDQNDGPAVIEQVFSTLRAGGFCSIRPSSDDLHSDAQFVDGDIDIVFADWRLLCYAQTAIAQHSGKFGFPFASKDHTLVIQLGSGFESGQRFLATTHSRVRGMALSFDYATVNVLRQALALRPLETLRVGSTAHWNVAKLEPALQSAATHTKFIRQLLERGAGEIVVDELVDVEWFAYSGHVYDLQTATGHMVANGLLISNCRCAFDPA